MSHGPASTTGLPRTGLNVLKASLAKTDWEVFSKSPATFVSNISKYCTNVVICGPPNKHLTRFSGWGENCPSPSRAYTKQTQLLQQIMNFKKEKEKKITLIPAAKAGRPILRCSWHHTPLNHSSDYSSRSLRYSRPERSTEHQAHFKGCKWTKKPE